MRVGEVRRVVCGCPSYFEAHGLPRTPGDLTRHRVVAARPATPTDDWRFADGVSVRVKPRLAFNANASAIAAVKDGWGLTRVLSYQIGPELGGGALQTVLTGFEPEPLPIHLVHAEGARVSAKVRRFIDLAAARLRVHPHLG